MEKILDGLPKFEKDKNLIVGFDTHDDAAVYKIDDKVSIIETVDFFPAMVEDPYIFGEIAATNALSDVWAMGGKPIMALNIACFPDDIDTDILNKILKGGADKVKEAGCQLCGGHTIVDETIKYGLSVTGIVDTNKILKNNSVKVGDKLILTKPLGVGIMTTAFKCDDIKDGDYEKVIKVMTTLNKYAAEILTKYDIHALTDVTGFGLLIHLDEMLSGNSSAKISISNVPLISDNVRFYAENDYYTGASSRNEKAIIDKVDFENISDWQKLVLYDPQTSGGLICAIDAKDANKAIEDLAKLDMKSAIIGEVIEKREKAIYIS